MKNRERRSAEAERNEAPRPAGGSGLYAVPEEIETLYRAFAENRPGADDSREEALRKQREQEKAVRELVAINAALVDKQGMITYPVLITRLLPPLLNKPRCQAHPLDRSDAEPGGRPMFVPCDPALRDELRVGDVGVVSGNGNGVKVISIDHAFPRSGEVGEVVGVHPGRDFPYELELENDRALAGKRLAAVKWERLTEEPAIGDRVKVMGGVVFGWAEAPSVANPYLVKPRTDLTRDDLHGAVPNYVLNYLLAVVDKFFHGEKYPTRTNRSFTGDRFLLYGPQGVGKTFTVMVASSILAREFGDRVVFISIEGSAVEDSLVGSGPKRLAAIRETAVAAINEGKLPVTFINEAAGLLLDRETQGLFLDGGSSQKTHEQFMTMLSGPNEIPGLLIVDLNTPKLLDEATRQRFSLVVAYPHTDRLTFVDRMFRTAIAEEPAMFAAAWDGYRAALTAALDTQIGQVLVGAAPQPVKVANVISGRLYSTTLQECARLTDLNIYLARRQGQAPYFEHVTPPLLYTALTRRAWSLFQCMSDRQVRERLVPEIARPEKASAIGAPSALNFAEMKLDPDYDCRALLEELAEPPEAALNPEF